MRTRIIRIGNSRGIRIPRAVLEQCGFEDEAVLEVERGRLIVRPAPHPREGWDRAFAAMARRGDDRCTPMEREASQNLHVQ